jgi:hypothetical protein
MTRLLGFAPAASQPTRTLGSVLDEVADGRETFDAAVAHAHDGCGRCEQLAGTVMLTGSSGLLPTISGHLQTHH